MKILKFLFLTILFLGFTNGESLIDHVKSNYEYIGVDPNKIIYLKEYKSNINNSYYLVDQIYYYILESIDELNYLFSIGKLNKDKVLFMISDNAGVLVVDLNNNLFDISKCKNIDIDKGDLFQYFVEKKNIGSILDKILGTTSCYKYNNEIYIASDSSSAIDMNYIYLNTSKIVKELDLLYDQKDTVIKRLEKIYSYVQKKTSYNFTVLYNLEVYKSNPTPWLISTFFKSGKIVCDGYVKSSVFIMKYFGLNAERVVGKFQAVEKSKFTQEGILHSWIKLGNLYFDPTFDDSDDEVSFDYFAKSITCFSLNHYTTGWVELNDISTRYNYIKQNSKHLIENCGGILKNVLFQDDKIVDFIKYSLTYNDLENNKNFFCETLNFCDEEINTKELLLSKIKTYKLVFSSKDKYKTYILSTELKDYNINFITEQPVVIDKQIDTEISIHNLYTRYGLSEERVKEIENIMQLLTKELMKYSYSKRLKYAQLIQAKIDNSLQKDTLSSKRRAIINYFNDLFVVEKFK